ncbi:MAG TPA: MBL fold metallo-hydrolase [Gaiellaceae bacterium]|nr:MBL fold metallo-hydrolase [Gaiellaceae bacterium]
MDLAQIAPHLWWWTAPHPDWGPQDLEGGQGWARDVSCYALVESDELVLFDPLVPAGDEERFWAALDGDVEHHGPPRILVSVFWHARSAREILERFDGAELLAHERAAGDVAERVPVTRTFADGDRLPGGVEAIAMHHMDEAAFWLPSRRAMVFGDSVLGYEGRADVCPASWLRDGESTEAVEASVRRALEREPELLLLTHGGPRPRAQLEL